ncbi:type VII secretion protein EccB [Streptomyces roseicoloratus]|uniref:Type VII secretion protein EccB n=1 Tax=Streptomyces roseicoloratus TaxID=2508722 RepID=A0ABY9RNP7_9ACTN|nr:type VII secretion protein EccB [Streptomyces roseicoloratus]WMX43811.1 type VII secretion protein EccB [Streptomyces roseicoloratus]
MSAASLAGERHGPPVGIPGAPDALPARSDLEQGAWQVCAGEPVRTGSDGSGRRPVTSLRLGADTPGQAPGASHGILVQAPDGTRSLLWDDRRLRLGGHGAVQALGYGDKAPLPVSAAFLDSVPAGPDLTPPEVPGRGTPGPAIGGGPSRTGQVYALTSPGAAPQHYLLERTGLRPLSELGAALVLGDDRTAKLAYAGATPTVLPLAAAELTRNLSPRTGGDPANWPRRVPAVRVPGPGTSVCARIQPEGTAPRVGIVLVPTGTPLPAPRRGRRSHRRAWRWTGCRCGRVAGRSSRRSEPAGRRSAPRRIW